MSGLDAQALSYARDAELIPFNAEAKIYPHIVVVPPPGENYPSPKPKPPPDRARPADSPDQTKRTGHYEGRTWVPD